MVNSSDGTLISKKPQVFEVNSTLNEEGLVYFDSVDLIRPGEPVKTRMSGQKCQNYVIKLSKMY